MQNLVQLHAFLLELLSRNKIPTSIKGYNFVINLRKLTHKNPDQELVNINAYANFGQIQSIFSPAIERKRNSEVNQGPSRVITLLQTDGN